jgi:hypothetical protein
MQDDHDLELRSSGDSAKQFEDQLREWEARSNEWDAK